MTDLATPTIPVCRFSYGQWRASLAKKRCQDPSGLPIKKEDITRLIGPIVQLLPYTFGVEHYAGDIVVCGVMPLFLGYGEQPGLALWKFDEGTILVFNHLNRRLRGRIKVILVESELRSHLLRLIHQSREQQQLWTPQSMPEERDPHGPA